MRFGRGFDAAAAALDAEAGEKEIEEARRREEESLIDMIGESFQGRQTVGGGKKEKGKEEEKK